MLGMAVSLGWCLKGTHFRPPSPALSLTHLPRGWPFDVSSRFLLDMVLVQQSWWLEQAASCTLALISSYMAVLASGCFLTVWICSFPLPAVVVGGVVAMPCGAPLGQGVARDP